METFASKTRHNALENNELQKSMKIFHGMAIIKSWKKFGFPF
jgi:hypothetical protein